MPRNKSADALFAALRSPSARVRYASSKSLRLLSEQSPGPLYPYFDRLFELFEGDNTILRWNATRTLGNLAAVDRDGKLEARFDRFFAPLLGPEMIGAANIIAAAAAIARARPLLANRISAAILRVERATYRTPECRNVVIGHAIQSLDRFLQHVTGRGPVLDFVERQSVNPRAATRRKAERFLKRWSAFPKAAQPQVR